MRMPFWLLELIGGVQNRHVALWLEAVVCSHPRSASSSPHLFNSHSPLRFHNTKTHQHRRQRVHVNHPRNHPLPQLATGTLSPHGSILYLVVFRVLAGVGVSGGHPMSASVVSNRWVVFLELPVLKTLRVELLTCFCLCLPLRFAIGKIMFVQRKSDGSIGRTSTNTSPSSHTPSAHRAGLAPRQPSHSRHAQVLRACDASWLRRCARKLRMAESSITLASLTTQL